MSLCHHVQSRSLHRGSAHVCMQDNQSPKSYRDTFPAALGPHPAGWKGNLRLQSFKQGMILIRGGEVLSLEIWEQEPPGTVLKSSGETGQDNTHPGRQSLRISVPLFQKCVHQAKEGKQSYARSLQAYQSSAAYWAFLRRRAAHEALCGEGGRQAERATLSQARGSQVFTQQGAIWNLLGESHLSVHIGQVAFDRKSSSSWPQRAGSQCSSSTKMRTQPERVQDRWPPFPPTRWSQRTVWWGWGPGYVLEQGKEPEV